MYIYVLAMHGYSVCFMYLAISDLGTTGSLVCRDAAVLFVLAVLHLYSFRAQLSSCTLPDCDQYQRGWLFGVTTLMGMGVLIILFIH